MKECKYCKSTNLVLEPKGEGDVLTADMVAIKCGDCGKWLGWCPKSQRTLYSAVKDTKTEKVESLSTETQTSLVEPKNSLKTDFEVNAKSDAKQVVEQAKQEFLQTCNSAIVYKDEVIKLLDKIISKM